jgi:hypothetical protein
MMPFVYLLLADQLQLAKLFFPHSEGTSGFQFCAMMESTAYYP